METKLASDKLSALREIAAKSPEAIFIADIANNKILFANTTASTLLDLHNNDDLAKVTLLIDSVEPADREYVMNRYRQMRKLSAIANVEFRLVNSANKSVWLSCKIVAVDNNKFLWAVVRDITKEKEHENYMVEYSTRKNTLLDTVIHELSGALGLMNNLAMKAGQLSVTSDQAALQTFVSLVQSNSEHCIQIIDDTIRQEYAEAPGIDVKFSRVDVVKLMTYIFEELKKSNGTHKLILETNSPTVFINTDDFKLLLIINNLASNARKFTPQGNEIRLSLSETDISILITVADTGIGIPLALQPFLFEKHGPARRTGLNGEKSVGLGLSICKNLVDLLRGNLWFESEEGKGSTFFLELPKD